MAYFGHHPNYIPVDIDLLASVPHPPQIFKLPQLSLEAPACTAIALIRLTSRHAAVHAPTNTNQQEANRSKKT